jgi:hypothetical protein
MWRKNRKRLDEILEVEKEQLRVLENIEKELHPRPSQFTHSISIRFTGSKTMNTLVLNVGQESTATITPLEADGVTVTPGAVVSQQIYTLSDPSLTIVTNADGSATITGVAASAGAVSGTAQATVTDADGAVATFSEGFTVTVNGVTPPPPPTGLTTSIGVTFSTPVDIAPSGTSSANIKMGAGSIIK